MPQLTLATVGNRRPDCMFTFAIAIRAPRLAIDIGMESPLVQVGRSASPSDDSITARIEAAFVGRIGAARFSLWFPPNARLLWFGHELVIASRNSHFQEWADDKFGPALREAVAEVCGEGVGTRFVSDPDLFADPKPAKAASPTGQLNLLGEPCPRDTANAVGFPAAVLLKRDPEAVMVVVTVGYRVGALGFLSMDYLVISRVSDHFQYLPHGLSTVLNLDYQQMGLGGDDSWTPRTHAEYLLPPNRPYTYSFRLRPTDARIGWEI